MIESLADVDENLADAVLAEENEEYGGISPDLIEKVGLIFSSFCKHPMLKRTVWYFCGSSPDIRTYVYFICTIVELK